MAEENVGIELTARDSATNILRGLENELRRVEERIGRVGAQSKVTSAEMLGWSEAMTRGMRANIGEMGAYIAKIDEIVAAQRKLIASGASLADAWKLTGTRIANTDLEFGEKVAVAAAARAERVRIAGEQALVAAQQRAVGTSRNLADVVAMRMGMGRQEAPSAEDSASVFTAQERRMASAVAAANARQVQMAQEIQQRAAGAAAVQFRSLQQNIDQSLGIGVPRTAPPSRQAAMASGTITAETSAFAMGGAERAAAGFNRELRHVVAFFDEAARGQRGAMFSTLGAAMRDAGVSAGKLATGIGAFVAVATVGALIKGAENMGRWAEESKAAANATGMTVNQFTRLQQSLVQLGEKQESADTALRTFARNVSEALVNPSSRAAQALRDIGVSMDALKATGGNTYQAFQLVVGALHGSEVGAKRAGDAEALFGRGLQRLEPLIDEGVDGLRRLGDNAERTGNTLNDQTQKALEETGRRARELGFEFEGKLKQSFVDLGPVIRGLIDILGLLATTAGLAAKAVGGVVGALNFVASGFGLLDRDRAALAEARRTAAGGVQGTVGGEPVPDLGMLNRVVSHTFGGPAAGGPRQLKGVGSEGSAESAVSSMVEDAEQRAQMAAKTTEQVHANANRAKIQTLRDVLAEQYKSDAERQASSNKELADIYLNATEYRQVSRQLSAALIEEHTLQLSSAKRANKQSYEDFAASEKEKIAEAKSSANQSVEAAMSAAKQIDSIYREWASAAQGSFHQTGAVFSEIEAQRVNAARAATAEINRLQREEDRARIQSIQQGARDTEQQQRLGALLARAGAISAGKGAANDNIGAYGAAAQQSFQNFTNLADQLGPLVNSGDEETSRAALDAIRQDAITTIETMTSEWQKASEAAKSSAKDSEKYFTEFFNKAGGQFDAFTSSALKALVAPQQELIHAGLTTLKINLQGQELRQAAGKLFLGLGEDLVNTVKDSLLKVAAQKLAVSMGVDIGSEGGMGTLLSKLVGNLFGSTVNKPQQANFGLTAENMNKLASAAGLAAEKLGQLGGAGGGGGVTGGSPTGGAGGQTTSPDTKAIVASQQSTSEQGSVSIGAAVGAAGSLISAAVGGSAGRTISAVVGALESVIFLLAALNVKPSVLGFTYSQGGIVPSAAGGMVVGGVSGGQPAILHAREMVLPAHISTFVQNAAARGDGRGSGGGSANINYSPQINAKGGGVSRAEFSQMLSSHSTDMVGMARQMVRGGWRPGF